MDSNKPITEMSPQEYAFWIAEKMMGGWVPIEHYMRMFPHEKRKNIDIRLQRGIWQRGVHYSVPDRSNRAWINLLAVRRWIEEGQKERSDGYDDNHSPKA